ncbi:MAG: zinc-ribbon domain-containing protein [Planctomycetes bacterium]|nr:zinc-ribbon domain-containing protein [Planctomycetota bacterium]
MVCEAVYANGENPQAEFCGDCIFYNTSFLPIDYSKIVCASRQVPEEKTMIIWWATIPEDRVLDKGFIDCPRCEKRQPAKLVKHVETSWFMVFPVSSTEGPEQLQCGVCERFFPNNGSCAFGHLEREPDWECFKCGKPIPHSRHDCPHWGFRLTNSSVL